MERVNIKFDVYTQICSVKYKIFSSFCFTKKNRVFFSFCCKTFVLYWNFQNFEFCSSVARVFLCFWGISSIWKFPRSWNEAVVSANGQHFLCPLLHSRVQLSQFSVITARKFERLKFTGIKAQCWKDFPKYILGRICKIWWIIGTKKEKTASNEFWYFSAATTWKNSGPFLRGGSVVGRALTARRVFRLTLVPKYSISIKMKIRKNKFLKYLLSTYQERWVNI